MKKKLLTPEFKVSLKDYILTSGMEVSCFSSSETKSDWCKVELTSQLQKIISYEDSEPVSVQLGYDGDYDILISGYARRTGSDYWKEILIRDDMIKLERVEVKATFRYCEPQDILKYILKQAGIDELVGEYISEIALVDEENDIVAIATFMAKGKDTMEDTFSIQDLY